MAFRRAPSLCCSVQMDVSRILYNGRNLPVTACLLWDVIPVVVRPCSSLAGSILMAATSKRDIQEGQSEQACSCLKSGHPNRQVFVSDYCCEFVLEYWTAQVLHAKPSIMKCMRV
eukprot:scaffold770_cov362-Pavlova_lutheri.AAC.17